MQTRQSVTNSNNQQPSTASREKHAAMKTANSFDRHGCLCLLSTFVVSPMSGSFAGSATWKASAANGDWFTVNNWVQRTIPNGPGDTATFASSNRTSPYIAFNAEVNGIVFNPGASAFTITNPRGAPVLTISGAGITNNSGIVQHFVFNQGAAQITFLNSATAGSLTAYTNAGT